MGVQNANSVMTSVTDALVVTTMFVIKNLNKL